MKYTSPARKTVNPEIIYGIVSLGLAGHYAGICEAGRLFAISDPGVIAASAQTPEQCLTALNEAIHEQAL